MKKLERPSKPPSCLSKYRHGANNWQNITPEEKKQIWKKIDQMQNGHCAYCECSLTKKKHIEHFRAKDRYPKLTFEWINLFGSCNHSSRCGNHKDHPKVSNYNPNDLIKPDEECASDYLLFLSTGKVQVRLGLTAQQQHKAKETIRVFNLNGDPALVNSRRNTLKSELENINALYEMQDGSEQEEWLNCLQEELDTLTNREYSTALEHAWRYNKTY